MDPRSNHESVSGGARTEIVDGSPDMGLDRNLAVEPRLPMVEVALLNGSDETDQTFIDVAATAPSTGLRPIPFLPPV